MELFVEIVNGFQLLTISGEYSILVIGLGSEYASQVGDAVNFRTIVSAYVNYSKMKINRT